MSISFIPLSKIVEELKSLVLSMASGIFFIATEDNKLAKLVLKKGQIVKIDFAGSRGEEAVFILSQIVQGRSRFQAGEYSAANASPTLPSTPNILKALSGDVSTRRDIEADIGKQAEDIATMIEKQQYRRALNKINSALADMICDEIFDRYIGREEILHHILLELEDDDKVRFKQLLKI